MVQLVWATAHVGVVLLDKIPAHFILGKTILHLASWRDIRRRRGLRLLEGGGVHGTLDWVEVGIRRLRRESAVHRNLGCVGHCRCSEGFFYRDESK